ncbi:MAG: hypothetical protein K6G82_02945 [Ruminococcus sp.]|nr:hypothetical protein [Ruminococcus sp.]
MKKYRRISAAIASAAIAASLAAIPMSAGAATTYSSTLTTIDALKTTTLDKYLVMKADANVPNAKFTFSVTSGDPVAADKENGTLAVLAGVGTPVLTNSTMTFSTADTATLESAKGTDTPVFLTEDTSDEKYVKKTLKLDFSSVKFTEPGVYRYIITETGTNQGVTNGYIDALTASTDRTLDVYVIDAGTTVADGEDAGKPQLMIEDYVMYNGKQAGAPKAEANATAVAPINGAEVVGATKNNTITNVYSSQDLTFGKVVTGNQGSKDKYFEYTVVIDNLRAENAKFSVDLTGADGAVPDSPNAATKSDYAKKVNPAELAADTTKTIASNGYTAEAVTTGEAPDTVTTYKITAKYYLQHGQYITIQGLPAGATYSVTEDEEDYSKTAGIAKTVSTLNWDGTEGSDALTDNVSGTINAADIHTGYTNDRSGTIPTGILTHIAGSLGIVAVGAVGVTCGMVCLKKKKSEDEEG